MNSALLRSAIPVLAMLALIVLAYAPGATGGFVFDDFPNVVDNLALRVDDLKPASWIAAAFSSESGSLQRPIAMLSFAINEYFTGVDPDAMKWTNIGIHAFNALLVFGLVRALLVLAAPAVPEARRAWCALFAAAAWGLHPINTMGVLYIVQRMESLAHTFVFAGLWLYLVGRQRQLQGASGRIWIGCGLVGGTALGVLCKESAVLLPVYAWLLEMCIPALRQSPQRNRNRIRILFAATLWLPLVAGLFWLWPRVTGPNAFSTRDFTLVERLLTEGRVVLDYLRWSVLPNLRELTLYHDDYVVSRGWWSPPSTLFAMFLIAGLLVFAWWLRGRRPLAALGLLWFFAAQPLTATVIPLELAFEHRNYFASIGVCLLLVDVLLLWRVAGLGRIVGPLVAACALLFFAGTTHLRAREWRDPLTFAHIEAQKRPESPRAAYAYGRMLVIATDYKADSPLLRPAMEALERARAVPKSGILPHSALLLTAAHTGQPLRDAWWTDMQARLRANPIGPQEINSLASIVRCVRNRECDFPVDDMIATFRAALDHPQPHPDIYNLYADYAFNVLGKPEDAVALWYKIIAMRPTVAQYRINLIKVLIAMGRRDEAKREIVKLRDLGKFGESEAATAELERRMPASWGTR